MMIETHLVSMSVHTRKKGADNHTQTNCAHNTYSSNPSPASPALHTSHLLLQHTSPLPPSTPLEHVGSVNVHVVNACMNKCTC
jgi:hypothetical protein